MFNYYLTLEETCLSSSANNATHIKEYNKEEVVYFVLQNTLLLSSASEEHLWYVEMFSHLVLNYRACDIKSFAESVHVSATSSATVKQTRLNGAGPRTMRRCPYVLVGLEACVVVPFVAVEVDIRPPFRQTHARKAVLRPRAHGLGPLEGQVCVQVVVRTGAVQDYHCAVKSLDVSTKFVWSRTNEKRWYTDKLRQIAYH